MREESTVKCVETKVTTYFSDDGKVSSSNKNEVELYEARQRSILKPLNSFYLPDKYNKYEIFKIDSRDDLLTYMDLHKDAKRYCDRFRAEDVPEKVKGYFISHYDDDGDNNYYEFTPLDRFIKDLKGSIEADRKSLQQQEEALAILESYEDS